MRPRAPKNTVLYAKRLAYYRLLENQHRYQSVAEDVHVGLDDVAAGKFSDARRTIIDLKRRHAARTASSDAQRSPRHQIGALAQAQH
ncbi:hypothetical protein [Herbaspirillum huttiense]|uniref:hypothetical protein n=1 Tax=Herbaspirillum huttiense TaxID=863372 RepID=UPI0039B06994